MSQSFGPYTWITTADESPTLARHSESEWMHSSGGALSESIFIYGRAIDQCLAKGQYRFVSVGLGLGYNELLCFCLAAIKSHRLDQIQLRSFETDSFLISQLLKALREGANGIAPIQKIYQHLFEVFRQKFEISELDFKNVLSSMIRAHDQGRWLIDPQGLGSHTQWPQAYSCFLYDAFSSQTNPELWEESFLKELLQRAASFEAVWSTYASTGVLKRVLRSEGFKILPAKGFFLKRESTFAIRTECFDS